MGRRKVNQDEIKRYNLSIPRKYYNKIILIAMDEHTSVLNVIRQLIKIALTIIELQKKDNLRLIVRDERGIDSELVVVI